MTRVALAGTSGSWLHAGASAAHDHSLAGTLLQEVHPNRLAAVVSSVPNSFFGNTVTHHGNIAEHQSLPVRDPHGRRIDYLSRPRTHPRAKLQLSEADDYCTSSEARACPTSLPLSLLLPRSTERGVPRGSRASLACAFPIIESWNCCVPVLSRARNFFSECRE